MEGLENKLKDISGDELTRFNGGRSGERNKVGPGITLKFLCGATGQPMKPFTASRKRCVGTGLSGDGS